MDRARGRGVGCLVRARPGGVPGGSGRGGGVLLVPSGRGLYSGWGAVWVEVWKEGGGSLTLITSQSEGRRARWPCPQGVPSLPGTRKAYAISILV